jgi:hypothetical protein
LPLQQPEGNVAGGLVGEVFRCRLVTAGGQEPADVLDHDKAGPQCADGAGTVGPDAAAGARMEPGARPGRRHILAREAPREDVHGVHGSPVDRRDITQVGYVRVVVGEDQRRTRVVVRDPGELATEHRLHGHS